MPEGTASDTVRSTVEHAALTLPQQQRLDELRERHREIVLNPGPGGTIEATVHMADGEQHIYREKPGDLLDAVEAVIEQDQNAA